MYLIEVVSIYNQLEKYRTVMHEKAMLKGFTHPEVLEISKEIDELVNKYLQIVGIKSQFMSNENSPKYTDSIMGVKTGV